MLTMRELKGLTAVGQFVFCSPQNQRSFVLVLKNIFQTISFRGVRAKKVLRPSLLIYT